MKVDRAGRVYVGRRAGGLGLRARRPPAGNPRAARRARRTWPGAIADARGLAITAVDAVYHVRLRVEGIMPPFLPG